MPEQRRLARRAFPQLNPRRFEICMTSARRFVERGFEATSVNDIASALGVTKAGLYHYISSKEALFFEILSLGMDWLDEDVIKPVRAIEDPEARLRETIKRHALLTACNEPWITELLGEMQALRMPDRETILVRKRTYVGMVRHMFNELAAAGRLRDHRSHRRRLLRARDDRLDSALAEPEGAALARSGRRRRRDLRAERAAQAGRQDARHRHGRRRFQRSPLKNSRISPTSRSGCSSAAKCPPRGISV